MRHIKPIARAKPQVAGETAIWCQLAVILEVLGIPVPKELIEKCIGVNV